jgi:hypothetical protein
MESKSAVLKELRKMPGVGKVVAADLWSMGYRHNDQKKEVQDICMLYTFRCAVYFANTYGQLQDKEKLRWWYWMDKKKVDSKTKDAQIRKKLKV